MNTILTPNEPNEETNVTATSSNMEISPVEDSLFKSEEPALSRYASPEAEILPGTHLPMPSNYTWFRSEYLTPEIDKGFILAIAATENPNGSQIVGGYHQALHDRTTASRTAVLKDVIVSGRRDQEAMRAEIKRFSKLRAATKEFLNLEIITEPWNLFDRLSFLGLITGGMLFQVVEINSIATTLQESLSQTFILHPWRAWLFSSVALILTMVLKFLRRGLATPTAKNTYNMVTGGLTVIFGIAWCVQFAQAFPGIGQGVSSALGGLNDTGAMTNPHAMPMVILQLLAASFGIATMVNLAEDIYRSHQGARGEINPKYRDITEELDRVVKNERVHTENLSGLVGRLAGIEAEGAVFVGKAVRGYEAMASSARQNREIMKMLH